MATDPVPEPLTNQEVREENRAGFPVVTSSASGDIRQMPPALPPADGQPSTSSKMDEIKSRVSDVADRAQQTASQIKDRVSDAAGQAQKTAAETYEKAKDGAARTYEQASRRTAEIARTARARSRQLMHDYPFHVIAGAATFGFVLGVALRIWRSSRYE